MDFDTTVAAGVSIVRELQEQGLIANFQHVGSVQTALDDINETLQDIATQLERVADILASR